MALIIDGYNLLNAATDLANHGGSLAQSRTILLDFLADRLNYEDRRATTVVFDGRHAPPGLEPVVLHRGITVRFARPHCEADDVIEDLIRKDNSPRRLTVVSSDHRLHRAARRRRAVPIDSDVWFRKFIRRPIQGDKSVAVPEDLEPELASPELQQWLREYGDGSAEPPRRPGSKKPSQHPAAPTDFENPFPPGYAEDLLRDNDPSRA
jgi:uncharacterized protein